jgi:hypothetical protein
MQENSLEKFLGKKIPCKMRSLEAKLLGRRFLGKKIPQKKNSLLEKKFLA